MNGVKNSRCAGKTKEGKPCRAAATAGGLCFFHANPKKASELGRIGGKSNGRKTLKSLPAEFMPLNSLGTVEGIREMLPRLIAGVLAGEIPCRVAGAVTPLLNLQTRCIELALDNRVSNLEARLAKWEEEQQELLAQGDRRKYS